MAFLRNIYEAGVLDVFDVVTVHPYRSNGTAPSRIGMCVPSI